MREICRQLLVSGVAASLATVPFPAVAKGDGAAERHIAAAEAAAGGDFKQNLILCRGAVRPKARPAGRAGPPVPPVPPGPEPGPAQAFDNLYFLGSKEVSAWAVKTSAGVILIDSMDNGREAESFIVGGMRRLGLDPAQIRYLIITHAHGDHYGGAQYLVDRFHPRVIMSAVDWKSLEGPLQFERPDWGPPPKRDLTAPDGMRLTLGDETVTMYVTPGHTLGTLSLLIPVRDHGQPHVAALWGGTGFNFRPEVARFETYAGSAERFAGLAEVAGADTPLSNHAFADGTVQKLGELGRRREGRRQSLRRGVATVYAGS